MSDINFKSDRKFYVLEKFYVWYEILCQTGNFISDRNFMSDKEILCLIRNFMSDRNFMSEEILACINISFYRFSNLAWVFFDETYILWSGPTNQLFSVENTYVYFKGVQFYGGKAIN